MSSTGDSGTLENVDGHLETKNIVFDMSMPRIQLEASLDSCLDEPSSLENFSTEQDESFKVDPIEKVEVCNLLYIFYSLLMSFDIVIIVSPG